MQVAADRIQRFGASALPRIEYVQTAVCNGPATDVSGTVCESDGGDLILCPTSERFDYRQRGCAESGHNPTVIAIGKPGAQE